MAIPSEEGLLLMALQSVRKSNSAQWKKIRRRILQRDLWECYWCGADANTVDHLVPVAKGGLDIDENLVAACKKCNYSKQDKMPDEFQLQRAGLFLQGDSTAHISRGSISPKNGSVRHE